MERTFGRLQELDPKSKRFPVRMLFASSSKHRSYTWSCDQTLDQGPDGACVGFAWAHELIARPSGVQDIDANFAKNEIYFIAQKLDPWEGGSYPGASSFYEGTSVLAGAKATMSTGYISGYHWAFTLDDLIMGVGHRGPAVMGINWYEGMNNPKETDNWFAFPTGKVLGGHAVLVRAVNVTHKYFTVKNSWGSNWGRGGDFRITFDDMQKLMDERGVACFATGRRTKLPLR